MVAQVCYVGMGDHGAGTLEADVISNPPLCPLTV